MYLILSIYLDQFFFKKVYSSLIISFQNKYIKNCVSWSITLYYTITLAVFIEMYIVAIELLVQTKVFW